MCLPETPLARREIAGTAYHGTKRRACTRWRRKAHRQDTITLPAIAPTRDARRGHVGCDRVARDDASTLLPPIAVHSVRYKSETTLQPDAAQRLALQRRAVENEKALGTEAVSKMRTILGRKARPLQAPVGRTGFNRCNSPRLPPVFLLICRF